MALGSLAEISCLLTLAHDLTLLSDEAFQSVESKRDSTAAITWLLYKSMLH